MAFGHDEEVGGKQGAGFIARKLEESLNKENEKLSFILDEGMFVMDGVFPGVSDPVAYVGNDYKKIITVFPHIVAVATILFLKWQNLKKFI